jgi:hypothetical protein
VAREKQSHARLGRQLTEIKGFVVKKRMPVADR